MVIFNSFLKHLVDGRQLSEKFRWAGSELCANASTQARAHARTHTHLHTHTDTYTSTHTLGHTHKHTHAYTPHISTHTQTHAGTRTHSSPENLKNIRFFVYKLLPISQQLLKLPTILVCKTYVYLFVAQSTERCVAFWIQNKELVNNGGKACHLDSAICEAWFLGWKPAFQIKQVIVQLGWVPLKGGLR